MKTLLCSTAFAALLSFPAVAQDQEQPSDAAPADSDIAATATATIEGEGIEGTVTFTETPTGVVLVEIEATGVPAGEHGVHFHQTGECDAASGHESAGGHIAGDAQHGVMNENGPHPGDLPNVHVQENGIVHAEFFATGITVTSDGEAVLMDDDGSAFILHAGEDDYMTDPSGESGDRIACGVIEAAA